MPFPSALSGTTQTKYRNGTRSILRYVVPHTPTVMMQFNPDANASGTNSQIPFDGVLSGATTNIEPYMSVYITPTADYLDDLQTQPENCLRTYVRKDPTSAILYIGLTAFQWTTSHYVTVVDNFEVFEKKTVIEGNVIQKNVDVAYRAPLPRIYDFYHDVVIATGSTYDYSPTPSFEAMASGASISSYDWTVIENGTVTQAASTSATPTFALDVGTHWLHLTVTDSNGNSNVGVAFIAVVPSNYASVVSDLIAPTVENTIDGGTAAEIIAYNDTGTQLTTLVPGAFGIVFSTINFTDNTSLQVVEMCGWFDAPVTIEYVGDADFGIRKQYSTRLLGVREVGKHIRIPQFPFSYRASPSTWGQVTRCTVYDALWHTLSEHSTIPVVATIELPSGYTDYQYNPAIPIPSGTIMDSMDAIAFRASGGQANYSPNGEIVFAQSAIYMTSGRDALTTYATYSASEKDAYGYTSTRPPVNRFPLSSVQGGFATWNTTTNLPRTYRSIAPANETPAALFEQFDGVIMVKNLSNTNAENEAGKLASNHFFAAAESIGIRADLVGGYITIVPSCFQWHDFDIAATDLLDGSSFDSNTRFLCLGISSEYDAETASMRVTATFRAETDGGDNYARETEFIPSSTEQIEPVYPVGTFSPFLGDFDIQGASAIYGDNFDSVNQGYEDPTLAPEIAAQNASNNPGVVETLYVPLTGGAVSTSFNTTISATYTVRVTNSGYVTQSPDAPVTVNAGVNPFSGGGATGVIVGAGLDVTFVSTGSWTYDGITSYDADGSGATNGGAILPSASLGALVGKVGSGGSWFFVGVSNTITMPASGELYLAMNDINAAYFDNSGTQSVSIAYPQVTGDAFYYSSDEETWTVYSGQGGLNRNGSGITHGLSFNSEHAYEFTFVGDGNPAIFSYVDTVDADLTNNENKNFKVEIFQ